MSYSIEEFENVLKAYDANPCDDTLDDVVLYYLDNIATDADTLKVVRATVKTLGGMGLMDWVYDQIEKQNKKNERDF